MNMFDFLQHCNRPDRAKWKPHANAGDSDRVRAYQEAAKRIGIEIKVAYPTPCPAGADLCHSMGSKGIYIKREDEAKEHALSDKFFECLAEINN